MLWWVTYRMSKAPMIQNKIIQYTLGTFDKDIKI